MVNSLQAGLVDLLQRVLGELDNLLHRLCRGLGTKLGNLVRKTHDFCCWLGLLGASSGLAWPETTP